MKRRIKNQESFRLRTEVSLLRRLGCGLWFLLHRKSPTSERRTQRRRGAGRRAAPRLRSQWTAVKLPKFSAHRASNTRDRFNLFLVATLLASLTGAVPLWAQSAPLSLSSGQVVTPTGNELSWPREFEDNGTKVDIYQPQIEKWSGTDFETRSAVAITPPGGSNAPVYGVYWMKARADVDKAARIVTLNDVEV